MPYEPPKDPSEAKYNPDADAPTGVFDPDTEAESKAHQEAVEAIVEVPTAEEAAEAVSSLQRLLDTLIPPESLEFCDGIGTKYKVASTLPAKRQKRAISALRPLVETKLAGSASALASGDLDNLMAAFLSIIDDDEVLESLSAAFAAAHPKILRLAQERFAEADELDLVEDKHDPAEYFPAEELIKALVPFLLRLVSTLVEGMTSMTKVMSSTASSAQTSSNAPSGS
jgi:hypothetical protein